MSWSDASSRARYCLRFHRHEVNKQWIRGRAAPRKNARCTVRRKSNRVESVISLLETRGGIWARKAESQLKSVQGRVQMCKIKKELRMIEANACCLFLPPWSEPRPSIAVVCRLWAAQRWQPITQGHSRSGFKADKCIWKHSGDAENHIKFYYCCTVTSSPFSWSTGRKIYLVRDRVHLINVALYPFPFFQGNKATITNANCRAVMLLAIFLRFLHCPQVFINTYYCHCAYCPQPVFLCEKPIVKTWSFPPQCLCELAPFAVMAPSFGEVNAEWPPW